MAASATVVSVDEKIEKLRAEVAKLGQIRSVPTLPPSALDLAC